jgi:hypothetical protein
MTKMRFGDVCTVLTDALHAECADKLHRLKRAHPDTVRVEFEDGTIWDIKVAEVFKYDPSEASPA